MKRTNLIDIGLVVSTLTAVIFLVGIARIDHGSSAPAYASGVTATAGEYVVTVGSLTDRDEELVYVINTSNQHMASYRYDVRGKALELVQQLNLEDLRKPAGVGNKGSTKPPAKNP